MSSATVGIEVFDVDLTAAMSVAFNDHQYDYVVAPLVHPRFVRDVNAHNAIGGFTRSDTLLGSSQWNNQVLGTTSSWLELDALDEPLRVRSEAAFKQEIAWAAHLGLSAVIIPPPREPAVNYARCVARALAGLHYLRLLVRIPLVASPPLSGEGATAGGGGPVLDGDVSWRWWNQMRVLCDHHKNLYPALELTADLPSDPAVLERWCGEPVQVLILPTSIFLANRHGFPVLSKAHQAFVLRMSNHRVQYVVSGVARSDKGGMASYAEYMRHLLQRDPAKAQAGDAFDAPYRDVLQAPLQPLQDNLESQTYETFERDPVKYDLYEEAVRKALLARFPDASVTVVLMVVGAGRGPLVRAAFRAASAAKRTLRVYAVEKNPNAVVTLMAQKESLAQWRDSVTVVSADMRTWQAPELADILVSELLGSFGDNESSPECLDGAQKFLKPDGISIPRSYVSFVAPITSHRLHNEVRAMGGDAKHFETPYVVKLHNVKLLAPPQPCFTFVHPTPQPANNDRFGSLTFRVDCDALLHGFAGYFDATLYDDVHCSIEPSTHSPAMFSWFPLFFPLRSPTLVTAGAPLTVSFWRRTDGHRMYYEWAVTAPFVTSIHNPGGRSYYIGL
jgi:protein arginine N-methyltransferase 5